VQKQIIDLETFRKERQLRDARLCIAVEKQIPLHPTNYPGIDLRAAREKLHLLDPNICKCRHINSGDLNFTIFGISHSRYR